jgi:hypothetical protein
MTHWLSIIKGGTVSSFQIGFNGSSNGASPQPDEPCLRLPVSWGLRAAGEDRDRRAGTVYEPS